jgi:hypothetical protein
VLKDGNFQCQPLFILPTLLFLSNRLGDCDHCFSGGISPSTIKLVNCRGSIIFAGYWVEFILYPGLGIPWRSRRNAANQKTERIMDGTVNSLFIPRAA